MLIASYYACSHNQTDVCENTNEAHSSIVPARVVSNEHVCASTATTNRYTT